MTTFVLVPGFWLGAWAWDEVATELRAAGHEVHAVELGADASETAESHVDDVLEVLGKVGPAVLVGHSGGGPVGVAAAERARELVEHLVFVDTGVLPDGMAQIEFTDPEAQAATRADLAAHDGFQPMPGRARLAGTDGLDDRLLESIRARSRPEPAGVITTGIRRGTPDPTLPKTVITCTFTEAQARGLIDAGLPGFAEMGGAEWSFVALPTGHWPMFSEPVRLAELLAGLR
ncbi:hypothetical protein GCM10009836_70650 [Pseudonocardia ailaonensis]|uniref:AB hydrolase-1 domain-containing protein n=1 Tax=Pseudonocardia ailaonensis TaxID=367279 RepID=A0ABN2NT50_9PSEU